MVLTLFLSVNAVLPSGSVLAGGASVWQLKNLFSGCSLSYRTASPREMEMELKLPVGSSCLCQVQVCAASVPASSDHISEKRRPIFHVALQQRLHTLL